MEKKLITAPKTREVCGGVSDMSLWRWLNDPALCFPRPIYIGKRRYFRESEVLAWIEAQAQTPAGNGRTAA